MDNLFPPLGGFQVKLEGRLGLDKPPRGAKSSCELDRSHAKDMRVTDTTIVILRPPVR